MGSKQYHKWRVTFSISEEAYEKLNEVEGNRSTWVEQLILGSPIPEDGRMEVVRLDDLEKRMAILETTMLNRDDVDRPSSMRDEGPGQVSSVVPGVARSSSSSFPRGGRGASGRQRAADPRFQAEVVRRYEAGETITVIMKELRTGHGTVIRILEEQGLS